MDIKEHNREYENRGYGAEECGNKERGNAKLISQWYARHDKSIALIGGILLVISLIWSITFITNLDDIKGYIDDAGAFHALRVIPYLIPPFLTLAALPAIAFIYMTRRPFEMRQIPLAVVSAIISLFIVGSQAMILTSTIRTLFINSFYAVFTILALVSIGAFVFLILRPAFYAIVGGNDVRENNVSEHDSLEGDTCENVVSRSSLLNKPTHLLIVFGILILAWLPYFVVFFPGSISYDMHFQLAQFIGGPVEWTNHHPVISTLIYGSVFSLGDALGGNNVGLLFMIIFQVVLLAGALTAEAGVIAQFNAPRWVVFLSVGFFALYPVFPCFADNAVKDTLFAAAFTLYCSLFILYIKDAKKFSGSKRWMALLIFAAILCGVSRNNGIYIVLLSLPFLIFFHTGAKERVKALAPLAICMVLIPLLTTGAITAVGAAKGSIREALSVPLVQSVRYCIEHPDDMTDYERAVLDNTFSLEDLENRYDPGLSDDIKNRFNNDAPLSEYFAVWAAQGLRHPLTYLDAWAALTYGYWSVQPDPQYFPDTFYNHQQNSLRDVKEESPLHFGFMAGYDFRKNVAWLIESILHLPLVNVLMIGGSYTWGILILAALLLFAKKPRFLIVLLPCALLMLTDMFGPMNGLLRYFLGVVCVFPVVLWSCIAMVQEHRVLRDRVRRVDSLHE